MITSVLSNNDSTSSSVILFVSSSFFMTLFIQQFQRRVVAGDRGHSAIKQLQHGDGLNRTNKFYRWIRHYFHQQITSTTTCTTISPNNKISKDSDRRCQLLDNKTRQEQEELLSSPLSDQSRYQQRPNDNHILTTKDSASYHDDDSHSHHETTSSIKKHDVLQKRKQYFAKSLSISYENTDPCMMMKVRLDWRSEGKN